MWYLRTTPLASAGGNQLTTIEVDDLADALMPAVGPGTAADTKEGTFSGKVLNEKWALENGIKMLIFALHSLISMEAAAVPGRLQKTESASSRCAQGR